MTEELPEFIQTLFPASDKREDTFIGGLSMGAGGALNLGIRRPELYSRVIALSGGMNFLDAMDTSKPES